MKYIKLYESFEDIDSICKRYSIKNYTINSDGSIDVDGDVGLYNFKLTKLPLKFAKVSGNFNCSCNQLTTLEGFPKSVGGDFSCGENELTTLEFCTQSVDGDFDCSGNLLTTLEGCPQSVGGYFNCSENKLTSLKGCPQSVGKYFDYSYNNLKDLYGFPEFFDNNIYYMGNPVDEILDLFKSNEFMSRSLTYWACAYGIDGKFTDLLNEYGVIQQDGKLVILDRLEEVFHMLNMEIPEINLKNYEVY